MYQNLENVLKPFGHREGRTLKLTIGMLILLGILNFMLVNSGATWESDKRSFILLEALAIFYIAAIPLGRIRTQWNIGKNFDRFTEAQLQQMDKECGDKTLICGIVVTSHALVCERHLIPISDIIWIYEQNSTKRGVATINYLIVVDKRQKQHWIPLSVKAGPLRKADPEALRKIKEQLLQRSPGIYFGYSKDIQRMYRENFAGMIAYVEENFIQMHDR